MYQVERIAWDVQLKMTSELTIKCKVYVSSEKELREMSNWRWHLNLRLHVRYMYQVERIAWDIQLKMTS